MTTAPSPMQEWPLLVHKMIDHAAFVAPAREIVTQTVEGPVHRSDWSTVRDRSIRLMTALAGLGVRQGDRVSTLAWNTYRHVECWYGTTGLGAVSHTVNPRLFEEQILYILNHACARVLLFDLTFLSIVDALLPRLSTIQHFVVMTDRDHMPANRPDLLCYEELLSAQTGEGNWAKLDENAPCGLCYTSGTTGNPKGVCYTHRSNVLHAMAAIQPDVLSLSARSVAMPIVPMFHANAWAFPYAAAMVGAKLVLNGPEYAPDKLVALIKEEGVTISAAVPTIWQNVLKYLRTTESELKPLERILVGGAAAPRTLMQQLVDDYGIEMVHAWGLTETSPIGSTSRLCATALMRNPEEQMDARCKQGRPVFGIEMTISDENGQDLPHDAASAGHLKVKGPWVANRYYEGALTVDDHGWFDTGDIATIDPDGYMQITDRAKDIIKSGGEWISSVELENAAIGCPGIDEAAAIGVPDDTWSERPLLVMVREDDAAVTGKDVASYLSGRVAKWWIPDRMCFVDALPHTATGKLNKMALRESFLRGSLKLENIHGTNSPD